MATGVIYALLSMVFAGVHDVIFKKYSAKNRSRGMYICGIGVVWALLQLIFMQVTDIRFDSGSTTIQYGLLAGIMLTISNISLVESLTHINVSLGSTIYRLNTIGVVILSFLVLHESIVTIKIAGIILGILAVILMNGYGKGGSLSARSTVFFWIAVLASLFRALYGVVAKAGLSAGADLQTMLLVVALCWVIGGFLYAKFIEKKVTLTRKKMIYSLLSGFIVFCIVNFLMSGLENGEASVIIPIANMSFIIALLVSLALKLETLDLKKAAAIGLALCSIILLSQT